VSGIAVKNNRYEVLTPSGWQNFVGIRRSNAFNLKHITIDGHELTCTSDHLLQTERGMVAVCSLVQEDKINTTSGYKGILNLDTLSNSQLVYDLLEVENGNLYYTNDIVSHNCEFLGSSGTLISGAVLKALVSKVPISNREGLIVYEEPIKGNQYAIVADVSRGKGLDYSAFQVIDVTKMPYNQVCVYRNNLATPLDYSGTLHRLGKAYNYASILVENNDAGIQVVDSLHYDYEYENIIYTENAGASGKRISAGFTGKTKERGVRTTKTVKGVGCSMLKLLIEQQQLIIQDHQTIFELSRFSRKGTSYEAEDGCNDDLVMSLVLFAWMSDQQYFKDLTNINTLQYLRDKTDEELDNDMFNFFMDDGQPDTETPAIIDLTDSSSMMVNKEYQFF
jgi:hypothetical protein